MGDLGAFLPTTHLHIVPDNQALFPCKLRRVSHRGYTLGWMGEIYDPSSGIISKNERWRKDSNNIYWII
jgi:hypothetical protein